jgi:hypothetical protein
MPRRNLARRFEPRYGVNQSMLETERKWVERELEDKLLCSANELRDKLAELRGTVASSEQRLTTTIGQLPDRERLALKCMLARDMFHIAALYETFLRSSPLVQDTTGTIRETPEEVDRSGEMRSVLIFRQSLFD